MYGRSCKDYFGRNRRVLYMILGILLVSISSLTIIYAALSVTLSIVGNSEVVASSWDVHLENVKVTSGSVSGTAPSITGGTTVTFSTNLTTPGDFYEFKIDVVNDGSIDAMIDGVSKTPTLTTAQAKYLKYEVEYQNGESINTRQLVKKNDFVRLKVRLEFRKDITASDLPTTSETLNLAFTVNYVQSDDITGVIVPGKSIIKVVSGDGTQVGDEICIGEECFYVISSTTDTVTMLSKYNLYVGNSVDLDVNVTPLASPTGKQSELAKGMLAGTDEWYGTTAFSNTDSTYSGSIVEGYVNNYNSYLITQGVTPIEARLITKDELIGLGCSEYSWSCSAAPSWVYATSYWSGLASDAILVWRVYSNTHFGYSYYYDSYYFGVRPVITISRSLI